MFTVHTIVLRMSNAFLIENDHGLTLVDAGSPGDEDKIMEAVRSLGKSLNLIFITHAHFDHYGSANALRAKTGAPVAIHADDAEVMAAGLTPIRSAHGRGLFSLAFLPLLGLFKKQLQTPADLLLQDGDRFDPFGIPAYLLHTPGHTAGSSCLVMENGQQEAEAVFVGDLVTAGLQPALQRLYADDWDDLYASLLRLQASRPNLVYSGHGLKPIGAAALQRIK